MDSTVVVAGLGLASTLLSAVLGAKLQRLAGHNERLLEARLRVYAECSDNLIEYSRATYNRVKSRLQGKPEAERDLLRQEAYRYNAKARSAIGQTYVLTGDRELEERLSLVRHRIGDYNSAGSEGELRQCQQAAFEELKKALELARVHLAT